MERADYFKMIWTPKNPGSLMSELAVLGNKLILREPKNLMQKFLLLVPYVGRQRNIFPIRFCLKQLLSTDNFLQSCQVSLLQNVWVADAA